MASSENSTLLPNRSRKPEDRRHPARIVAGGIALSVFITFILWWITPSPPARSTPAATTNYICGDTPNEAGYIKLANKEDDHYFYWFFEARNSPETAPLVIWLTGGPGGSSLLALFMENGPCRVQPDLTTKVHPYAWTQNANMIWLDQPTSVGFSHGAPADRDFDEKDVGANLYWFLQGFLDKHPEFDGRPFFLTGESYAGHYVPGGAHYIRLQNELGNPHPNTKPINLQGIAIGNGWTDPVVQTEHQMDILDNAYNVTLLSAAEIEQIKIDTAKCINVSLECQQATGNRTDICGYASDFCYSRINGPFQAENSGRNPYDIREECDWVDFGFCHGIPLVQQFLNQTNVLEYLNVTGPWVAASDAVSVDYLISGDFTDAFDEYVAVLLNAGIRVLLYVGDADSQCNWGGNKAWIDALEWNGRQGFIDADEHAFLSHDPLVPSAPVVNAGTARSFENLALVRIFNAGHMVPTHQPAVALDLIDRFLKNEAL